MARIELDRVSLTFRLRTDRQSGLKDLVLRRLLRQPGPPPMEVHALREVSLCAGDGERLGVIGHNGAGKSTLLKLLAGVYPPTSGRRVVEGRISSLFDIVLGFEPQANGWENIGYRCYLQGETPHTVRRKRDSIAEFSELGRFLDMPVRHYSTGMMVRLAFSIATAIDPEVLLVDEVLSAGDAAFQAKARARIRELMASAHLIVVVSHDLVSLGQMCDRVVWLDHGQVRQLGASAEVIDAYQASVAQPQAVA